MNELKYLLKIFSNEFNQSMDIYNDRRNFHLIEKSNPGKFLYLRTEGIIYCFSCLFDQADIEIIYNQDEIIKKYLKSPNVTIEILKDIFKYLANHEYGHSLICESSVELGIYTEWQEEIVNILKKFNFKLMDRKFREYFADYKAKEINPHFSQYFLDQILDGIEDPVLIFKKGLFVSTINPNLNSKDDIFFYSLFTNTQKFYIFDEWTQLNAPFLKYQLKELLNFLYYINLNFEKIINKNSNLNSMRDDLAKFMIFLDNLDYDDLILNNKLSEDLKLQLKKFF